MEDRLLFFSVRYPKGKRIRTGEITILVSLKNPTTQQGYHSEPGTNSTITPAAGGHTDQAGTRRQPLKEPENGVLPTSSTRGRGGWTVPHDQSPEPPGWQTSIPFLCIETQRH